MLRRSGATLAAYGQLALLTTSYGAIGPLMPFLRADLGLNYTEGSYHSAALAIGAVGAGFVGHAIVALLGRRASMAAAFLLMGLGHGLVCGATGITMSLTACLLFGAALAVMSSVVPALLTERHPAHLGQVMAEANMVAYLGILVVPGLVSLMAALTGWRWTWLPLTALYLAFWLATRRIDPGAPEAAGQKAGERSLPFAYWCFWSFLALSVAAEISVVVWGPSFLEGATGLNRSEALLASMAFPAGMLIGRAAGALLMRHWAATRLALPALALAAAGLLLLLAADQPSIAMAGLALTGLGMANLYPVGITLAMLAAPGANAAASARSSIASGAAMLMAPLAVGAVADKAGLTAALAMLPLLLVAAAVAGVLGQRA